MTQPTAHPSQNDGWEDSAVTVDLTGFDADDEGGFILKFRVLDLPAHGTLYWGGAPVTAGTDYWADYYQDGLGWHGLFYFVPDPDWSGEVSFGYAVVDNDGEVSAGASATLTVAGQADAPVVRAGANDAPAPEAGALQVTTTNTSEDSPQLAALDGGRALMVWQQGLTTGQILGRVVGADGTPEGVAFAISPSGAPSEISPAMATRADGGFAAAWIVDDFSWPDPSTMGGGDVQAAFYAAGSTTPSAVVTVAGSADAREASPDVIAAGDGYVVTWAVEDGASATLMAQRYTALGALVGGAIEVASGTDPGFGTGAFFDPPPHAGAAAGGDGSIVVTYAQGGAIMAAVMDTAGSVSAPIAVSDGAPGGQPVVTALADGGFAVAWTGDDEGRSVIDARLFDADGAPRTDVLTLASLPFSSQFTPAIGALPDGRLALAWIGNNGASGSYDVFTQVFTADGAPSNGGPVAVTQTGLSGGFFPQPISEIQPTLTVLSDGTYSVGWMQPFATGGQNHDVFTRTYDPGPAVVTGAPGGTVELPTTFALTDTDGSEVLVRVVIQGLPEGFSLDAGARAGGDPAGDWVIDRDADAAFLDALAGGSELLTLSVPTHFDGPLQLQIGATSQEGGDPAQTADSPTVVLPVSIIPNAAPIAAAGSTTAYTEQAAAVAIDTGLALSDPDNATLEGAVIEIDNGFTAGDVLGFADQNGITGDYDEATGTLTLSGAAGLADYQTALRSVTFASTSDDPTGLSAARTIAWQVSDGFNFSSAVTSTVEVTPMNDAPLAPGPGPLTTTEDAGVVTLDLLAGASDPDNADLDVTGVSYATASGDWAGPFAFSYDAETGVLSFDASQFAPMGAGDTAAFTVDYQVTDWAGGTADVQASITVDGLNETVMGTPGDDGLQGTPWTDEVSGLAGDDVLRGLAGDDSLWGGEGDDLLQGGAGADFIDGGAGSDTASYAGSRGGVRVSLVLASTEYGDSAGDTLIGIENLLGSSWGDKLTSEAHANALSGGAGRDKLVGGGGCDTLDGGAGRDVVKGGMGDDLIRGGWDGDRLAGGQGSDVFVFTDLSAAGPGLAEIRDLEAQDVIDLSGIDADTDEDGDQGFHLVDAFSGEAGQAVLAYDSGARLTSLELDLDGDAQADLVLQMKGDQTGFAGLVL